MIQLIKNKFKKKKSTLEPVKHNPLQKIKTKVKDYVFKHKCPKCRGRAKLKRKKNYTHGSVSRPIKSEWLECIDCGYRGLEK